MLRRLRLFGILGVDVLQHIKPYSHEELWVHDKGTNFIKLPSGYIPFGSAEQFLVHNESKILCRRLVERFVTWEDESSFNHIKVKSKGKKSGKENVASGAVPNENVNVKENLSDVRRDNFDFKPPKRVVGMCKYIG